MTPNHPQDDAPTLTESLFEPAERGDGSSEPLVLTIVQSQDQPELVGAVLLSERATPQKRRFGRGGGGVPSEEFLEPLFLRPEQVIRAGLPSSPHLSRTQLLLDALPDGGLKVQNAGRLKLLRNGQPIDQATLEPGDVLEIGTQFMLLAGRRPVWLRPVPDVKPFPFGGADADGLVGESAACWALRRLIRTVAASPDHVLVHGPSGVGKELVSQAIHAHSARRTLPMVCVDVSQLTPSLIQVQLCGGLKNYPNPGTPETPGFFGQAARSTLFLDEFAELPLDIQSLLARALDPGEYFRVGESSSRKSEFRVVAATNRPLERIKFDIRARLTQEILVPDLNARREDIPLLARQLMRRRLARDPSLARFFVGDPSQGYLRLEPAFLYWLLTRQWDTHLRELERLLVEASREADSVLGRTWQVRRGGVVSSTQDSIPVLQRATASTVTSELPVAAVSASSAAPVAPPSIPKRLPFEEDAQELAYLEGLRRHHFDPQAYEADPALPGNRQRADLLIRRMFARLLVETDFDFERTVQVLAGPHSEEREPLRRRLELFLERRLEQLNEQEGQLTEPLLASIQSGYRAYASYVVTVMEALKAGRLQPPFRGR